MADPDDGKAKICTSVLWSETGSLQIYSFRKGFDDSVLLELNYAHIDSYKIVRR